MKSAYANFDFANTWVIVEGQTRPLLQIEQSTNISTGHQLSLIALDPGGTYTLAGDVDLSGTTEPGGTGFAPIGIAGAGFSGTFNGQGYTISGLSIACRRK